MYETKTGWFIIVNPRAGSGKTLSGWTVAEKLLRERGMQFITEFTHYKSHARELALQAARDGYRRLLAAGGELGGRLLLLDRNGKVQMDSYGELQGTRLEYPEIASILEGHIVVHRVTVLEEHLQVVGLG